MRRVPRSSSATACCRPGPAPRFSRTPAEIGAPPRPRGSDSAAILRDWGFASDEVETWTAAGIVGTAKSTG
jgi:alpha-methylacyl-CoA racemase